MQLGLFFIVCALGSSVAGFGQSAPINGKYQPLPDRVMAAKTVFLINETENSRFGDDLYQELRKWNRWQVVSDKSKADLLLVLSEREGWVDVTRTTASVAASAQSTGQSASGNATGTSTTVHGQMKTGSAWYLHVIDAKSHETLLTSRHTMGGRLWQSWGSVARSLLSDVQKRLE